jgi:hypothetical protein
MSAWHVAKRVPSSILNASLSWVWPGFVLGLYTPYTSLARVLTLESVRGLTYEQLWSMANTLPSPPSFTCSALSTKRKRKRKRKSRRIGIGIGTWNWKL